MHSQRLMILFTCQIGVRYLPAGEWCWRGARPVKSAAANVSVCSMVFSRYAPSWRAVDPVWYSHKHCRAAERITLAVILLPVVFCVHEHSLEFDLQVRVSLS